VPAAGAGNGRYAPSPSSDLHLGNLRTAVVAWLAARTSGRGFVLRIEDLDERSRPAIAQRQLADLSRLGIVPDAAPMVQSERLAVYQEVLSDLRERGLVYPCFCSRREILEAPRAPHAPPGAYPGTCRHLTAAERAAKAAVRPPAWRLAAGVTAWPVTDRLHGSFDGVVDDFVLARADGTPAYNLAVVVDDAAQAVTQVVRGDDLLSSTARQAYLGHLLGYTTPEYLHVPLVLNRAGQRLSKRDGALAGPSLWENYGGAEGLLGAIGQSLGLASVREVVTLPILAARFDPDRLPAQPWTV
jgi:glutamyl-tRNA synthetase